MRISEIEDSDNEILHRFNENFYMTSGRVWVENGLVLANGDVYNKKYATFEKLPVSFSKIDGNFIVNDANLTTLDGCPKIVNGILQFYNNLTSLDHAAIECEALDVSRNPLQSLRGLPKKCNGINLTYSENLGVLRLLSVENLVDLMIVKENGSAIHEITYIIDKIIGKRDANVQQKMLIAKRELIKHGYEGNAKI